MAAWDAALLLLLVFVSSSAQAADLTPPVISALDSVETKHVSFTDRLVEAFYGILAGAVLVVLAVSVLWLNERKHVQMASLFAKGLQDCVHVDVTQVLKKHEGKLVHLSGTADCSVTVVDAEMGVTAPAKTLRLSRHVAMYQWVERSRTRTEDQWGGGKTEVTTYTYHKEWRSDPVDCSRFKEQDHVNPPVFPVSAEAFYASDAKVGAFSLSHNHIDHLNSDRQFELDLACVDLHSSGNTSHFYAARLEGSGEIFIGAGSLASPAVGDLKVSYTVTPCSAVSLIGQQSGDTLVAYRLSGAFDTDCDGDAMDGDDVEVGLIKGNSSEGRRRKKEDYEDDDRTLAPGTGGLGCCCCCVLCSCVGDICDAVTPEEIMLVTAKPASIKLMFTEALEQNACRTHIFRCVGFLMMVIGIQLLLNPIAAFLMVLPFLGKIVSVSLLIVAVICALVISSITIALAYLFYRPLLALSLFTVSGAVVYFCMFGFAAPAVL